MYFTQEDYKKIEKWLLQSTKKDTQFAEAATPLKGNETIAFVQEGKNVRASVKDIVDQLFLLGVSDFINISDKYDQTNIPLDQAIQLIPFRSRKAGQVITFFNEHNEWVIYQFTGTLRNQWNNLTLWKNVISDVQIGNVEPDYEDITGVKEGDKLILKFANKKYEPNNYSGLGRIYLRKNMIPITGQDGQKVLANVLTQSMLPSSNTIYHIQYDYDLNQQTLYIPNNSVLLFEGGSLSNGIIQGAYTRIDTVKGNVIFKNSINIGGTWNIEHIYDSWFEFDSSDDFISNHLINNIIALTHDDIVNHVHFEANRVYWFERPKVGPYNEGDFIKPDYWKVYLNEDNIIFSVKSNTHFIIDNELRMLGTSYGAYFIFYIKDKQNVSFTGKGLIYGDTEFHKSMPYTTGIPPFYGEWGHIFNIRGGSNFLFRDLTLGYNWGDCICAGPLTRQTLAGKLEITDSPKNVYIDNLKILYARRNGISIAAKRAQITNCYFEGNGNYMRGETNLGTPPRCGIDFECDHIDDFPFIGNEEVMMSNCTFKNNAYDISSTKANTRDYGKIAVTISDCTFESSLRLNQTFWIAFNNCYIPSITDAYDVWYYSNYLFFNNCNFGTLNPYYVLSAKDTLKEFNNCTYPEKVNPQEQLYINIAKNRAVKLELPLLMKGELELKAVVLNQVQNLTLASTFRYTIDGNSNSLRDYTIWGNPSSSQIVSSYNNIPVFSYVRRNTQTNKIEIYLTWGGNVNGAVVESTMVGSLFYNSNCRMVADDNGSYLNLDIQKSYIDVSQIPSDVIFPKNELYSLSTKANLPTNLQAKDNGRRFLQIDDKKTLIWDGFSGVYRTTDGFPMYKREGTFADMQQVASQLSNAEIGYPFLWTTGNSMVYWNGNGWVNEDGTLFDDVKILRKVTSSITEVSNMFLWNATFKICEDVDLHGGTLNMLANCTLDFQGGKIINGTINLNGTKVSGIVGDINNYIEATITGTYSQGQKLYDSATQQYKVWDGSNWINMDGTLSDSVVII